MGDQDSHEVLQRIDALLPSFRERAQETEDLRRLPPDDSIKRFRRPASSSSSSRPSGVDTSAIR